MKRIWLLLATAVALYGADISGNWSGKVDVTDPSTGDTISTPVKAHFEQSASAVSGKIGRARGDQLEQIRNARIDGSTLVFDVQPAEATSPMKFSLVVSGDRIEGDMKGGIDSGSISGKVTLTRSPQ